MAGEPDEYVGVDDGPDVLTTPRRKPTYQDFWNAAYRGLVPGGIQTNNDSTAPAISDSGVGTEAAPLDEKEQYVDEPEPDPPSTILPVIIVDDKSRVAGSVEKFIRTYTVTLNAVTPQLALAREPSRTRVVLINNGPGIAYLGHNESVGISGFPLPINTTLTLTTTRELWILQQSGQVSLGVVAILVEYDKETDT
jgi:hypothetical protein